MNGLLNLLANIILLGLLMWVVMVFIPLPMVIQRLLNILVGIVAILWILQFFGMIQTVVPMYHLLK